MNTKILFDSLNEGEKDEMFSIVIGWKYGENDKLKLKSSIKTIDWVQSKTGISLRLKNVLLDKYHTGVPLHEYICQYTHADILWLRNSGQVCLKEFIKLMGGDETHATSQ